MFCHNISIASESLGNEGEPLVVVDHFFEQAAALASIAAIRPFREDVKFYPGVRTAAPKEYYLAIKRLLKTELSSRFGFDSKDILGIDCALSIVNKAPNELNLYQRIPHFDTPKKNGIACVHYLFPDDGRFGGTSFYRHKSTGFEFVNQARLKEYHDRLRGELESIGVPNPPQYIMGDTDLFTRYHVCDAKFNRALFYRTSSLHSGDIYPDHNFSGKPNEARLTLTSFIQLKDVSD